MLLRRLTGHVKDQNWFAVGLDFFIVVIGVGAALVGQQWLSSSEQRVELTKAEYAVEIDVSQNYFNAQERVWDAACRKQRTRDLIQNLLEPSEEWAGMPLENSNVYGTAFEPVLTTSRRSWGSSSWDAELQRGTFNQMSDDRRYKVGTLFQFAREVGEMDEKVNDAETQLNVLSLPMTLSPSDRTHYLELLAYHDGASSMMEFASAQLIEIIEGMGLERSHPQWTITRDKLVAMNTKGPARQGDCFVPVTSKLFDISAPEVGAP